MITYEDAVGEMQSALPEVIVSDPDLPHVAFGALCAHLAELARSGSSDYEPFLCRVLSFMERAAQSADARVQNLVEVSFLENLHLLGSRCVEVAGRLGPATQRLRTRYESEWGPICPEPPPIGA